MNILQYWPYIALVIFAVAVVAFVAYKVYNLLQKPTEEQLEEVKEWLLYAVMIAEDALGSGTGQLKLRYVYDMFVERFPWLARIITFARFSSLVDEALNRFEAMLKTTPQVAELLAKTIAGSEENTRT